MRREQRPERMVMDPLRDPGRQQRPLAGPSSATVRSRIALIKSGVVPGNPDSRKTRP